MRAATAVLVMESQVRGYTIRRAARIAQHRRNSARWKTLTLTRAPAPAEENRRTQVRGARGNNGRHPRLSRMNRGTGHHSVTHAPLQFDTGERRVLTLTRQRLGRHLPILLLVEQHQVCIAPHRELAAG